MRRRLVPILALLAVLAAAIPVPAAAESFREAARDARRGIVYDGQASRTGACPWVITLAELPWGLCSHGPDAAPRNIDVRRPIGTKALRRQIGKGPLVGLVARAREVLVPSVPLNEDGVACVGTGSDGPRIVAVYAAVEGRPDRYAAVAPLIGRIAGGMDAAIALAAARTGGERHLRWLTTPDCALDVRHAIISRDAGRSFTRTIEELRTAGYAEPGRRYLVWTDARTYCGTGLVTTDAADAPSHPGDDDPSWARIDQGCWGSAELHELLHALGAVQLDAPHATTTFHCTDGPDPMCGDTGAGDGGGACPAADALLPDCGGDDYFSTAPAAGSWLASHRNIADSPYLEGVPLPPSSVAAPASFSGVEPTRTFTAGSGGGPATIHLELVAAATPRVPVRIRVIGPNGTVLATVAATLAVNGLRTLGHGLLAPAGAIAWEVTASGTGSYLVRVEATPPVSG